MCCWISTWGQLDHTFSHTSRGGPVERKCLVIQQQQQKDMSEATSTVYSAETSNVSNSEVSDEQVEQNKKL